ncbi:MAG: YidH family protein [Actinomycetota bacterium]
MLLQFKPTRVDTQKAKLQNPSRVRDHLANERTYLAWMRTAIALLGFGVVIVRLRLFQPPLMPRPGIGWKLGLMFSLVGLITVLISTRHYFGVRHAIDEDTYEPADGWVLIFSLIVMLLGTGVVYFIFSAPLNQVSMVMAE